MELANDDLEMLHFFCFYLLHDYKKNEFCAPNFKFVFTEKDTEIIIDYLESLKNKGQDMSLGIKTNVDSRDITVTQIEDTINLINEVKDEYKDGGNEDDLYIEVPDYKEFFKLLNKLMKTYEENSFFNLVNATSVLRSLWLRMSPMDMSNILDFIDRQIEFIKNDYKLPTSSTLFKTVENLEICYYNSGNQEWFETNRHIRPFIRRVTGEYYNPHFEEVIKNHNNYYFPAIHCGFIKENEIPTCYIYGIQNIGNFEKDPVIKNILKEERRRLRNKYVSPDFIIALKILVDILREKGITTIKVPLLQVYNYDYHQIISKEVHEKMASYTPEKLRDIELLNVPFEEFMAYNEARAQEVKFYEKEDIISANKTERLIYTFYLLAEKYEDIDIITEPFVESDHLICKIKYAKENKPHL